MTAPPLKQAALNLGLQIFQPEKIKNNLEFRAQLEAIQPDAIIVVRDPSGRLRYRQQGGPRLLSGWYARF